MRKIEAIDFDTLEITHDADGRKQYIRFTCDVSDDMGNGKKVMFKNCNYEIEREGKMSFSDTRIFSDSMWNKELFLEDMNKEFVNY